MRSLTPLMTFSSSSKRAPGAVISALHWAIDITGKTASAIALAPLVSRLLTLKSHMAVSRARAPGRPKSAGGAAGLATKVSTARAAARHDGDGNGRVRDHRRDGGSPPWHRGHLQPCRPRDLLDLVGDRDDAGSAPGMAVSAQWRWFSSRCRDRSGGTQARARLWQLRRVSGFSGLCEDR